MKAKKILEYLDTQRIDELRELILGEICKKKNRKIPTYKAIQKLSFKCEKDWRIPRSQNKVTFKWNYRKPELAGAYFYNNQTMLTNGYYGVIFKNEIKGLKMREDESSTPDLNRLIPNYENWDNIEIDMNDIHKKLTEKINLKRWNLEKSIFNIDYFLPVYVCFENPKYYIQKDKNNSPLIIKGDNGIGILMPIV